MADTPEVAASREQLRRLSRKVVLAAGRYYVDHGVGYHPESAEAGKPAWWARCDMTGARAVQSIIVRDCATGAEALEKLGDEVAARVKAVEARRRRRR
jgi:hypothetical protein